MEWNEIHETNFEIVSEVNNEIRLRLLIRGEGGGGGEGVGSVETGKKHKIKEIHAKFKCYSFKNQIVSPIPSVNKYAWYTREYFMYIVIIIVAV